MRTMIGIEAASKSEIKESMETILERLEKSTNEK